MSNEFDNLMQETPDPIIPFGKHRGKYASQVAVECLDWLIGQDWLKPELEKEIYAHLQTRSEWKRM